MFDAGARKEHLRALHSRCWTHPSPGINPACFFWVSRLIFHLPWPAELRLRQEHPRDEPRYVVVRLLKSEKHTNIRKLSSLWRHQFFINTNILERVFSIHCALVESTFTLNKLNGKRIMMIRIIWSC